MAGGTLGVLHLGAGRQGAPAHAPTMAFTTFVLFQVFNVLNVRAENGTAFNRQLATNLRLWLTLAIVVMLQVAVVHWPPLQRVFGSVALGGADWVICLGIAATVFVAEELRKLTARRLRTTAGGRAHLRLRRMAPPAR
jgi:Ca2+-transporting ATPase